MTHTAQCRKSYFPNNCINGYSTEQTEQHSNLSLRNLVTWLLKHTLCISWPTRHKTHLWFRLLYVQQPPL
jgi:hypothetical protein